MSGAYKILTQVEPKSSYAESFRKLQVSLQYAVLDQEVKVIQITSSNASEGKTLTCLNLATVYAEKNKKVIVVDLDLRNPKIHRGFKVINEKGITEVVTKEISLEDAIIHTEFGVDVLVRGKKVPHPDVLLESKACEELIKKLREKYDIIILDSPPVLLVTDALIISKLADVTTFVITHKKTRKDDAATAVNLLRKAKANLVGAILLQVDKSYAAYRGGYYSSFYYEYGRFNEDSKG